MRFTKIKLFLIYLILFENYILILFDLIHFFNNSHLFQLSEVRPRSEPDPSRVRFSAVRPLSAQQPIRARLSAQRPIRARLSAQRPIRARHSAQQQIRTPRRSAALSEEGRVLAGVRGSGRVPGSGEIPRVDSDRLFIFYVPSIFLLL